MKITVLAHFNNSYWGCNQEKIFVFDKNAPTEVISNKIQDWGCGLAKTFAYLRFGFRNEYSVEEYNYYLKNLVHINWEIIDQED